MEGVDLICEHGRKPDEPCPACPDGRPPHVAKPSRFDLASRTLRYDATPGAIVEYAAGTPPPVIKRTDPKIGIGGGPTRATILPTGAAERKKFPIATGLLDYFPDALAAISNLSYVGNEQHNPGQPLHWARGKSTDEADTMLRHFLQRGTIDADGVAHSVKMAWRCLALLQKELEGEKK